MLRRLAKLAGAVDLRDLLALSGLAATSYGAWLIFAPIGWIVAGLGLWYLGTWHGAVVGSTKIVVPAPESVTTTSARR